MWRSRSRWSSNLKCNAYVGSPSTSVTESLVADVVEGEVVVLGSEEGEERAFERITRRVPPIDYSRINKENYKTMTGQFSLSAQRSPHIEAYSGRGSSIHAIALHYVGSKIRLS